MIKQIFFMSNGYVMHVGEEGSDVHEHNMNLFSEHLDHLISIGMVDQNTIVNVNHETVPMKEYHIFKDEHGRQNSN